MRLRIRSFVVLFAECIGILIIVIPIILTVTQSMFSIPIYDTMVDVLSDIPYISSMRKTRDNITFIEISSKNMHVDHTTFFLSFLRNSGFSGSYVLSYAVVQSGYIYRLHSSLSTKDFLLQKNTHSGYAILTR